MNYYKDNPHSSRRWAWSAVLLYAAVLATACLTLRVGPPDPAPADPILVELIPLPAEQPTARPESSGHREAATQEQQAPAGQAEPDRTVNPRALFRQSQNEADATQAGGDDRLPQGKKEQRKGTQRGLTPAGSDQLDRGLQGRGLVGDLPKPRYATNLEGRVVIRVQVDASGAVTAASYEPQGSTISHPDLIREAREAALKARFTPGEQHLQGGTITYIFTLKQ